MVKWQLQQARNSLLCWSLETRFTCRQTTLPREWQDTCFLCAFTVLSLFLPLPLYFCFLLVLWIASLHIFQLFHFFLFAFCSCIWSRDREDKRSYTGFQYWEQKLGLRSINGEGISRESKVLVYFSNCGVTFCSTIILNFFLNIAHTTFPTFFAHFQ